jgi:glycopeptide antibiotics resistance protein
MWWVAGIAAAVSLAVEATQAIMGTGRLADITDVLANTAGATLGAALWGAISAGSRPTERNA